MDILKLFFFSPGLQKFLGIEKIDILGSMRGLKAVIKMSVCSLKSFEIAFYFIFMFLLRYFFPERLVLKGHK